MQTTEIKGIGLTNQPLILYYRTREERKKKAIHRGKRQKVKELKPGMLGTDPNESLLPGQVQDPDEYLPDVKGEYLIYQKEKNKPKQETRNKTRKQKARDQMYHTLQNPTQPSIHPM
jgi:hypothetical protein